MKNYMEKKIELSTRAITEFGNIVPQNANCALMDNKWRMLQRKDE